MLLGYLLTNYCHKKRVSIINSLGSAYQSVKNSAMFVNGTVDLVISGTQRQDATIWKSSSTAHAAAVNSMSLPITI